MSRVDRESPIHRSILSYLRLALPGALIFHPANEIASKIPGATPKQRMLAQARAKAMGMLPGAPDLVVLFQGRFIAFEVKAPGNYQQVNQRAAQALIEANGGAYYVVRSIDDVKAALAETPGLVELRGAIG